MLEETKKLSDAELREICEKTKKELFEFAPYVEASITTLEAFLPQGIRVTIILRKDDDTPGVELAGAMLRTNDDPKKIIRAIAAMAKVIHDHPEEFE